MGFFRRSSSKKKKQEETQSADPVEDEREFEVKDQSTCYANLPRLKVHPVRDANLHATFEGPDDDVPVCYRRNLRGKTTVTLSVLPA